MNRLAEIRDHPVAYRAPDGSPPSPSPFEAARRHPWLVLLPLVLLTAAGIAVAQLREPVYTSEARLGVGALSPGSEGGSSSVDANEQLAATYSRAIGAPAVVRPVARATGLTQGEVKERLSASALPESPLLKVEASSPREREAVALVRAGSDALKRYVQALSGAGASGERLLAEFESAQLEVAAAQERLQEADLAGSARAEAKAEADLETAKLRVGALREAYVEQTRGSGGGEPLRTISPADGASSDRDKKLKLYAVAGTLGGLVAGVALASAWAARRFRRRHAALR